MDLSIQREFRDACLKHARHLLVCAQRIENDSPHLAYHLATLTLEEIGKSFLVRGLTFTGDEERSAGIDKHLVKLFWALYAPLFYERIERRQVEEARDFALRIHRTRLAGLYVDWKDDRVFRPSEAVSPEQAHGIIKLADTRLQMEENVELRELTEEDRDLISWFSGQCRSKQESLHFRKRIFRQTQ